MGRKIQNRTDTRTSSDQSEGPVDCVEDKRRIGTSTRGAIAAISFAVLLTGGLCGMTFPSVRSNENGMVNGGSAALRSSRELGHAPHSDVRQDPQEPGEELTLEEFMQIKLLRSQDVMEGMATRDFTLISEAARDLQRLTEASKWAAHNSPEYAGLTTEFQTAIGRLQRAAKEENLEAVALRFYDMSTRCIDCHEHLRTIDF